MKIHQLPPHIIAEIAAGEVIERPAFAVKELIENAIDAHADIIQINIEQAGLKKIQVIDNGEGMSREDIEICWKPHTTSKISENDALVGIKSFGFRGEALASLAAISTLSIKSRLLHKATGNEVLIQEGRLISIKPTGMPQGTVVTAENLFASIPARKKFLKSSQTEMKHIVDVVTGIATAHPTIRFTLVHNARTILDTSSTKDTLSRIQTLVGGNIFQLFLPIQRNDSYIKLKGFIGKPQLYSSTTTKQYLFVNNRKITDKLISLAVKEAYGTMLESTAYPYVVLFLEVPYDFVDINVHPRKEQVSFVNQQTIFQFVKEAILETLQENNITFHNLSWKRNGVGTTKTYAGKLLKELVLNKEDLEIDKTIPLTQLHKLYLITQTKQGIILIDQHAAHERILFEKLKEEFICQKRKAISMKLQKPIKLDLSISMQLVLAEHKGLFEQIGFTIIRQTVTHIPQLFKDRNPQEFITQLLEEIEQEKPITDIDKTSEEMLSFLACHAAIKAGDLLEKEAMEKIIYELGKIPNNATCPHGRPTKIIINLYELHAMFKRN